MFLPSFDGGDASVLRTLGAPDSSLLAVDWNPAAITNFHALYPQVDMCVADVAHVLDSGVKLASAFLDFSCHVSAKLLANVRRAALAVGPGGPIACTFQIGREKKRWDSTEDRFAAVHAAVTKAVGYEPEVLHAFCYNSSSAHGPGSHMGVIAVQLVPATRPLPQAHVLSLHDLYRDVERHAGNPALHLLINCSPSRAKSLRSRVAAYPPPAA